MRYTMTARQKELYKFIEWHLRDKGVVPTFREMAAALDLKSNSGVHRLLTSMKERGWVDFMPSRARSLILLGPAAVTIDLEDPAVRTFLMTRGWTPPAEAHG